ncbi:TCP-1/cpn60 chaperonin family protein [Haladaptatus sp. R4]|uniref:TCP-1/cpn60 chaperonin family protein n=1 Tax=Haladaptatus sp. R4 TaxID=1679489 RepID=UPI001CBFFBE7|nr:TCP-1/cpn60 chaperonin family protein [Haladaptatus sp. R4]
MPTGAVAVFASGDIHRDIAQELGSRGVLTVQNVKDSRIEFLARATGAPVSTPLVSADVVEAEATAPVHIDQRFDQQDESWLAVTATGRNVPEAVSFVVRGGSDSVAREAERRVKDGLNAVRAAVMRPEALPGGGAAEIAAAVALRDFAPSVTGRAQLAVESFADAIETIPLTLARNAGRDALGTVLDLRSRHATESGRAGITSNGVVVDDVIDHGAFDPQLVRTSGFVRAVEFTNSYLRIDGILYNANPGSPVDGASS